MNTDGGALHFDAVVRDTDFNAKMSAMERRIIGLSDTASTETSKMDKTFANLAASATAFFSVQAAGNFISSMVQVRGQFQQIEIAFTTMLKSKAAADQLLAESVKLAATTPFSLQDVATGAKQLLAFGFAAKDISDNLSKLGNIAAGVSAPLGDIVYLYGTLRTQGRAYTRDILQFTTRGIPIIAELAKQYGVAESEIQGMVEAGKVGFPDVEKAFNNMTGPAGMFFNLMQEQSKSLTGLLSNLKDAWSVMLDDMGKSNQGIFADGIKGAIDLVQNYQKVLDILAVIIVAYGAYKAALLAEAAVSALQQANTVGYVAALNQESVAKIANAAATANMLRTEVSSLAARKSSLVATAALDAASVRSAAQRLATAQAAAAASALDIYSTTRAKDAKLVALATEELVSAKEKAAISRKAALSAATAFNTKQNELETVARVANSGATVQLTAVESLNSAGKNVLAKATMAYNAALAVSPMLAFAAAATALGAVIYALTQYTTAAEVAENSLNESRKAAKDIYNDQANNIQKLVDTLRNSKKTTEEQAKAFNELKVATGNTLDGFSQQEVAAGKADAKIATFTKTLKDNLQAEQDLSTYRGLQNKLQELEEDGIKAISTWDRLAIGIRRALFPKDVSLRGYFAELFDGKAANDAIVEVEKKKNKAAQDLILKSKNGNFIKSVIDGKPAPLALAPAPIVRNETYIKDQIKDLEESRSKIDIHSKEYADYTKKIKALNDELSASQGKVSKEAKKTATDRIKVLEDITKAENEAFANGLTKNEKEIEQNRLKYEELRKEAKKAGLGAGSLTRIDRVEKTTTGNIKYDQETDELKTALNDQKKLYDDFEEYKLLFGLDKAKERYQKELDVNTTYLEKLQIALALSMAGTFGKPTEGEQERIKYLSQQVAAEQAIQEKYYNEVYQSASSTNEKILQAQREYLAKYDALLKKQGLVTPEQKKNLQDATKAQIDAVKDEAFQKSAIYQQLNEDITYYTQQQLKIQIESLEEFLKIASNLPPELRTKLENQLISAKGNLGVNSDDAYIDDLKKQKAAILDNLESSQLGTVEYQKQLDKLKSINDELAKAAAIKFGKLANTLSTISGMASELSGAFSGINDEISEVLNKIGEMANVGASAAGATASFVSGDILGGVTQSISAIAGIIKSIGGGKAEMEAYYQKVFIGEHEYARMMRARQSIQENITELTIKELEARKSMLAGQSPDVQKEYDETLARLNRLGKDAEGANKGLKSEAERKAIDDARELANADYAALERLYSIGRMSPEARALFENLRASREEMEALGVAGEETEEVMRQIRTGTTASDLSNSLLDMFKNGKTGVNDFADFFENTMQDAFFSTFQDQVLKNSMKEWYAQFDEASKDGITEKERWQLEQSLQAKAAADKARFDEMAKISGIDLTKTNSSNSMAGGIERSITEETGGLIVGQFNGMRIAQLEAVTLHRMGNITMDQQLSAQNKTLQVLTEIKVDTGNIKTNTDRLQTIESSLKNIDSKMNNNANALAANGL